MSNLARAATAIVCVFVCLSTTAESKENLYLIPPADLKPDNVEFTIPNLPYFPPKIFSDLWGQAGKCGDGCLRFAGPALPATGATLTLTNLTLFASGGSGALQITDIHWTCGIDAEGNGKPCSGPVEIYVETSTGAPPVYKPTPSSPLWVSVTPAPEPATWVTLALGFGALGAQLRRRPTIARA